MFGEAFDGRRRARRQLHQARSARADDGRSRTARTTEWSLDGLPRHRRSARRRLPLPAVLHGDPRRLPATRRARKRIQDLWDAAARRTTAPSRTAPAPGMPPHKTLVNFLDNHDVPRFLYSGSPGRSRTPSGAQERAPLPVHRGRHPLHLLRHRAGVRRRQRPGQPRGSLGHRLRPTNGPPSSGSRSSPAPQALRGAPPRRPEGRLGDRPHGQRAGRGHLRLRAHGRRRKRRCMRSSVFNTNAKHDSSHSVRRRADEDLGSRRARRSSTCSRQRAKRTPSRRTARSIIQLPAHDGARSSWSRRSGRACGTDGRWPASRSSDLAKQFGADARPARRRARDPRAAPSRCSSGPSGCGKSTLLRLLAGLEQADARTIHFGERDVTRLAAARPRHRDGVPDLRALPAPHRAREPRVRAEAAQGRARARSRSASREAAEHARPRPAARPPAEAALRRAAPARRHGPRDRAAARRSSSSTSRSRTSTPRCARRCASTSASCTTARRDHVYVTHDQVEAMTLADVISSSTRAWSSRRARRSRSTRARRPASSRASSAPRR